MERYVHIVLRSHPAAAEGAGLEAAGDAERKAVRVFPDPVFAYSHDRALAVDRGGASAKETGYSVSQTIPWPGTFAAGVRAGDHAADVLRAGAEGLRWDLASQARRAFARLVAARALLDVARVAEEDARSLRDLVSRRADLGESRESDRIKATVEWLREQRNLAAAERQAGTAEAILRTLAVEALPRPLTVKAAAPPPMPPLSRDALVAEMLTRSPRLSAARAEAERRRALVSVARRGRIPDLDVTLGCGASSTARRCRRATSRPCRTPSRYAGPSPGARSSPGWSGCGEVGLRQSPRRVARLVRQYRRNFWRNVATTLRGSSPTRPEPAHHLVRGLEGRTSTGHRRGRPRAYRVQRRSPEETVSGLRREPRVRDSIRNRTLADCRADSVARRTPEIGCKPALSAHPGLLIRGSTRPPDLDHVEVASRLHACGQRMSILTVVSESIAIPRSERPHEGKSVARIFRRWATQPFVSA